ncbi:hypothetical protein IMCC9480_2811 [Oxalobacteraceae bacterium IMCC9480]|nr:hypothetical protein IMCC9480_2811 [Oxalobacteraceae bacterium IMCC9480]
MGRVIGHGKKFLRIVLDWQRVEAEILLHAPGLQWQYPQTRPGRIN